MIDTRTPRLAVLGVGLAVIVRYVLAWIEGFDVYHGFNEAFYASLSGGFDPGLLAFRLAGGEGAPFYHVAPLHIALTWLGLWISPGEFGARLLHVPSIAVSGWCAWRLLRPLGGRLALVGSVAAAWAPWSWFWAGRAQAEPWLTTAALLLCASSTMGSRRRVFWVATLAAFVGFGSKQTFALALVAVPFLRERRIVSWGVLAGSAPWVVWWGWQLVREPAEVLGQTLWHASGRAGLFENAAFAFVFPMVLVGPLLLVGALRVDRCMRGPAFAGIGFWLFAIVDSPAGHEYYAAPAAALLATAGVSSVLWRNTSFRAVAVSAFLFGVLGAFVIADLPPHTLEDAAGSVPVGGVVGVPGWVVPQLEWYNPGVDWVAEPPGSNTTGLHLARDELPGCAVGKDVGEGFRFWRCP